MIKVLLDKIALAHHRKPFKLSREARIILDIGVLLMLFGSITMEVLAR